MNRKFGIYGGQYVPETLMNALQELERAYETYCKSPAFVEEVEHYHRDYIGRCSPLYYAKELTKALGGGKVYLKREDLNHTGSHKINNVIGQLLLAKHMGKRKVIAETGAGQHGVATATGASLMGMECTVYMGEEDIKRQKLNVFKMQMLGAKIESVSSGTGTLKDATNEAIRNWVADPDDTFYVMGSVVGPHPYPTMVRDFQSIIGEEARRQVLEQEGKLPHYVIACIGGGSNAAGIFAGFLEDKVQLIGVEAGGKGVETGEHAAVLSPDTAGKVGILHGMKTYLRMDGEGNILPAHSISAGLDYPGTGPEHAYLRDSNQATYVTVTDKEAVEAFSFLARTEGIIPALESAHAVAYAMRLVPKLSPDQIVIVNVSGRGDKDVARLSQIPVHPYMESKR